MADSLTTFGPYRVLRRLARGGMAEIFLAKKDRFPKTVVVKRILPQHADNEEFVQMFRDEARLAAQLAHPNIVHISDYGEVQGTAYLEMEYLQGHDLGSLLRTRLKHRLGPFPADVAATVAAQACAGLHYAHTFADENGKPLRIVHRDISPSNIFLTVQGAVKLVDFGIAKAEGKLAQTRVGLVKGKLLYMSPEQTWAKSLDGRADIWSLGVVLYELLTGERPFFRASDDDPQALNERATMVAIDQESPPRLCDRVPSLPAELDDIVVRCIEKSPANRFQTAAQLQKALHDFLRERKVSPDLLTEFMEASLGVEQFRALTQPTPTDRSAALPPPPPLPSSVDVSAIEPLSVSVETRSAPATRAGVDAEVAIETRIQAVETRVQPLEDVGSANGRSTGPESSEPAVAATASVKSRRSVMVLLVPLAGLGAAIFWFLSSPTTTTTEAPRDAGFRNPMALEGRVEPSAARVSASRPEPKFFIDAGDPPDAATAEPPRPNETAIPDRSAAFDAGTDLQRPVAVVSKPAPLRQAKSPLPAPEPVPPPAQAPRARGRLAVRCLPWGDVYVDDVLRAARAEREVIIETTPGPHSVECRHPDFGKRRTQADVKDTIASVTLDLQ